MGFTDNLGIPQKAYEDSELWLVGADTTLHGSVNDHIRFMKTVMRKVGNAIDYNHGNTAANGVEAFIRKDGKYAITYTDTATSAGATIGVSLNATAAQCAASINNLTATQQAIFISATPAASLGIIAGCTVIVNLKRGDVIRPHTDADANLTVQDRTEVQFRVTYIGPS